MEIPGNEDLLTPCFKCRTKIRYSCGTSTLKVSNGLISSVDGLEPDSINSQPCSSWISRLLSSTRVEHHQAERYPAPLPWPQRRRALRQDWSWKVEGRGKSSLVMMIRVRSTNSSKCFTVEQELSSTKAIFIIFIISSLIDNRTATPPQPHIFLSF